MKTQINYEALVPDKNSPEPLHMQLKKALTLELRSLMPNLRISLKSERELASCLNLSRPTTHRAYSELIAEGLVIRRSDKSLAVCSDARRKIAGSYRVIGVLLPMDFPAYVDNNNQNAVPYLKGLIGRCSELDISCMMLRPPAIDSNDLMIDRFIEAHFPRLYGLIHLGTLQADNAFDRVLPRLMERSEIPQVCVSGFSDFVNVGSVCADPASGMDELCQVLKNRGFRSVGVVSATYPWDDKHFVYVAQFRDRVMLDAAARHGLSSQEVIYGSNPDEWYAGVTALLNHPHCPEVLFCHNDKIAGKVIRLAEKAGLSVPEDLSVVGFDGSITDGSLASIRMPAQLVASDAVDMVVAHFEHGIFDGNRVKWLPTEFLAGKSLGVPRPKK